MRKAAALWVIALFCCGALSAFPDKAEESGAANGFSLFGQPDAALLIATAPLDRQALVESSTARLIREISTPLIKKDGPAPISLSVFMGRANGDPFSSLHVQYAWRTKFKTMNLGAGLYKDIPLSRTVRLQPYMGVIRSTASLRPADLGGTSQAYEYRLTVFCVGLPLVFGFN